MGGFSLIHWLMFGAVAALLFGNRLPKVFESLRKGYSEFQRGLREREKFESTLWHRFLRGPIMRKHWNKFLWSSKFWGLLGLLGCVSGLYFQRVASNGSGLWFMGLVFFGAAYLEGTP